MEILVANIILICIYGYILAHSSLSAGHRKRVFLVLAFLQLLSLNLLKDPSEFPDLDEYEIYFNNLSNNLSSISAERDGDRTEWGWYILNKFLHIFAENSAFLVVVVMAIATLSIYMVDIYKYSSCLWLSVVVLFCTNYYPSLFVIRQHLSIPICFFSIQYILNRDLKKFLIVVFIASLFHYSAYIWLFSYFIYPIRFRVRYIAYSIVLIYILLRIMDWLMNNLALLLPIIASYGVDAFDGVATAGGAYKPFLFDLLVILLALFAFRGFKNIKGINRFCLLMLYVSLFIDVFQFVGSSFAEFSRLGLYFGTCSIFLVPNSIMQIKDKPLRIIIGFSMIILYVFILNAFCDYGYNFVF